MILLPGTYTIEFSFVGYQTVEKTVSIQANQSTTLDVTLSPSAAALDEVVIKTSLRRDTESVLLLRTTESHYHQREYWIGGVGKIRNL